MSAFDDQNQAPDPRDQNKVNRYMSQYLNFDEEGLESEEYVSLVPENLIPFALETEVQDLTVIEEGEDTIRFHTEQIEYDEEYLEESMEEDYGCMHSEDEKDNDDEDTDEGTEYFAVTVNDHNYERTCVAPNKVESEEKAETGKENQKEEDDSNPNSAENKD
uniref:RIKEN cDNA 4930513O06 gene n=1 Tax=Mus spicilegus TaxID=10103 RepID=A0A8C6HJL2_MUSSI